MTERYDRRAFLRRLTAVGLAAPTISTLGCGFEEIRREDEEPRSAGLSLTRPVLLPWTEDAVRISAPLSELPAAYVSRELQKVFIELDSRIQIQVMLAAHISVSSGHWRIPLPGDDLGIPVDAGDALREFEETPIGEWNSNMDPMEGDFRLRHGQRENVEVAFDCMPMAAPRGVVQRRTLGDRAVRRAGAGIVPGGLHGDRYRIPSCTPGYRNLHRTSGARALRDVGVSGPVTPHYPCRHA